MRLLWSKTPDSRKSSTHQRRRVPRLLAEPPQFGLVLVRTFREDEMANETELKSKLWKSMASDRTMMVGLDGISEAHPRPLTAHIEHEGGPIWFFTARGNDLVRLLFRSQTAIATYASKGHDLFATIHGRVGVSDDRAVVDRLWSPFVAAWFKDGKDDPNLALLRFDPAEAEIWEDASSLIAGLKMLLGIDPKKDYEDSTAQVDLRDGAPVERSPTRATST
jgi:general stress protein 26